MPDKTKTLDEQVTDRISQQTKELSSAIDSLKSSLGLLWVLFFAVSLGLGAYTLYLSDRVDYLVGQPAPEQNYIPEVR